MVFVDGENLAIRFADMLKERRAQSGDFKLPTHLRFKQDVFLWSIEFNNPCVLAGVVRKYYYTSAVGDHDLLASLESDLKSAGIEEPRVFKRERSKGSKGVDISLTTDMLKHAFKKSYDVGVLVAGDGDYVPLVQAVKDEGRRVYVWFVANGLNPSLGKSADYLCDLTELLFNPQPVLLR
jgi:uncharacterized LabA/DUF88 family protein